MTDVWILCSWSDVGATKAFSSKRCTMAHIKINHKKESIVTERINKGCYHIHIGINKTPAYVLDRLTVIEEK